MMPLKKFISIRIRRNVYIVCSFIILSIISISLFSYFKFNVLFGASDMQFHIRRILELSNDISHHNFIPIYSLNYFHGAPIMGMYPYLSILPYALFIKFMSVIHSYYLFAFVIVFCSLITSFFSSVKFSKSIKVSYLFSVVYSMSSTFMSYIFISGDIGIATSMIFLPLVIFGFIDILLGYNDYYKFVIGIVLMSFCQIPSVVITIVFIIIWFIINLTKICLKAVQNIIKSFILISLLTSVVWMPIMYITFNNDLHTVDKIHLTGISMKFYIENLSIIPIITIFVFMAFFHKCENRLIKQMYIISIFIIIIFSKILPWKLITSIYPFDILNQFQYSFRFLIIPQLFLCYVFSFLVINYFYKTNIYRYLFISLLIIIVVLQLLTQLFIIHNKLSSKMVYFNSYHQERLYKQNVNNKYSDYGYVIKNNSIKYIVNGYFNNNDYYPAKSLNKSEYNYSNILHYNMNKHILLFHHDGYNKFSFKSPSEIKKLNLPILCYNKELLKIYLNNHAINYHLNKSHYIYINNIGKKLYTLKFENMLNRKLLISIIISYLLVLLWVSISSMYHFKIR